MGGWRRAARVAGMIVVAWLVAVSSTAAGDAAGPGDLIAFTRCRELTSCARGSDIWVMRPDATGLRRLTEDGTHNVAPSWAPDGGRIVFASGRNGVDQIWLMRADGTGKRRLTASRALDEQPAWSPDGRRIAFVRKSSATSSTIFLINADGTGLRRVTRVHGDYQHPTWSPDGRQIAFAYARDPQRSRYGIHAIGANGRGLRKLSARGNVDYLDPAWSLDGGRIAFSLLVPSGKTFVAHLETMDVRGGAERTLARAPANTVYFAPSWSGDGTQIVFTSLNGRKGLAEIGIVNADGSRLRTLEQLLGDSRGPAWRVLRHK